MICIHCGKEIADGEPLTGYLGGQVAHTACHVEKTQPPKE